MDFFGKTIDGSRSLYLDELTVTWNADILATSLFSKPSVFDTTLKITETLTLGDTNSVTLSPNLITTPYTLFLPPTQGTSNTFLENNGSGVLTWRSSLSLPYVKSVALSAPSFLTVSGTPVTSSGTLALSYSGTPLPVLNGGTGVTTSTGTGSNVLSDNAYLTGADLTNTYLDGTLTLASPLSVLNGGTGATTSTGSGSNVLSSNPSLTGANLTNTSLNGTLALSTPLSTSNGGTGLTSIGSNGQFLASNGTNLYWENGNQIGVMRYKQKYYPYIYVTPPAGMQLWFGGSAFLTSNIDFRTLYPVEGAQLGLSLTYGYEANFGRFVNEYSFPLLVEISYSVARFQPAIPVISIGETESGLQFDAPLAFFTTLLNGGTAFYIEKNNNGDPIATSSSNSGVFCTASITIVLQPNDFFQLRGSTTSTVTGLINVESEIFIKLQGINSTPAIIPSSPGTGTVTSVNINSSDPFFSVGGGPITTSGTLSIGLSGTALPTAIGGTGLTTVGTNNQVLTSNGTTLSWQTPAAPGTGTVTSVSATVPAFLSITGSPITSSGTLAIGLSGTALPVLNGGTGVTTSTGTGSNVLSNAPTFTGATINSGLTLGTALTTTNGGTGLVSVGTSGQVLTSNGSTLSWQTPLPPGTGTVTSVAATVPSFLSITGSPITTSGTLSIGLSGTALPTLSGGTGLVSVGSNGQVLTSNGSTLSWQTPLPPGTGTVTSVAATVPSFLSITGSPITTSGTLAIGLSGTALPTLSGGTGLTTVGTNGQVLTSNGTTLSWQTPSAPGTGTVTSVAATVPSFLSITGSPITTSGTLAIGLSGTALPVLNGGTGVTTSTGTGSNVLSNAPTFTGATINSGLTLGTALTTANGGTGLTTVGTNGQVLTSNGTTLSWQSKGTVTSVSATVPSFLSITGSPITTSGTLAIGLSGTALPIVNGGTGSTTATGTGAVVLQDAATMGTLTVTSGLQILGFGGSAGWTSILSNIGTGNNSGIRGDGAQNGFNFGWNVSGGGAESIITYGTLGIGRLDICSWDGTTRTTTFSINASGGVTFGTNLYPTIRGTSGQVLTTNGSGTLSWQTPSSPGTGTVTSVAASVPSFLTVSGSPITTSGTLAINYSGTALPVANGGTGVTTSTGTVSNVLSNNPTLNDTILNGITTATRGLLVNGGTGATGWTSILSGIGTNNNTGIRGDGTQNGFNFGWNVSGGSAESIMTYGTLGIGRLDICSWNGSTRTTTLSINSSGVVSLPLGAIISSGLTVNGDSLFTSNLTINGTARTPQISGSGTSGDITIVSTRDMAHTITRDLGISCGQNLTTNVTGNYDLTANNINLNSPNGVYARGYRIDLPRGYSYISLPATTVFNNLATTLELNTPAINQGTPLQYLSSLIRNTTSYNIVMHVNFTCKRSSNGFGQDQVWMEVSRDVVRYGFLATSALVVHSRTVVLMLQPNEFCRLYCYQDSGVTVGFNPDASTFLSISYSAYY
jgi:hypothetical protein